MHKKALKIVGVVFGVMLIVAGIAVICVVPVEFSGIQFYRTEERYVDNKLTEAVLVADISDNFGYSKEYFVDDNAVNAADMVIASKLQFISEELNLILFAVCVLMWIFGAGVIAVSMCIKTDDKFFKRNSSKFKIDKRICVQCGAPLPVNAKFCPKCGLFHETA